MSLESLFRLEEKDYKPRTKYDVEYLKQVTNFVKKMFPRVNPLNLKKALMETLNELSGPEPYITHYHKYNGVDREEVVTKLTDYIRLSADGKNILVPSFTQYLSPDILESSHGIFILQNIKERSRVKKLAFKYEMEGNIPLYMFNNMLQKTLKTYNNGLSGSYESIYNVLHNPSGHHTLTSITRTVASIGNLVTESIVSGNRYYETPDTVLNHFTSLLTYADYKKVKEVIEKYGLKYPTVDDVMDMVYYNTDHLWYSPENLEIIKEYVSKITKLERAIILYTTDLYHIRKVNPKFVNKMLSAMSYKRWVYTGVGDGLDYLFEQPDWVYNLVMHICVDEVRGIGIIKDVKSQRIRNLLGGTAQAVNVAFRYYADFLNTFFATIVSPINVAKTRDMLRRAIVVSDTDSTCGTYQEWVEWKYNKVIFGSKAIGFTAAVMTITTRSIDHYIRVFAANMNIQNKEHRDMLKMKNEFYWDVFGLTNVGKHYFANVVIQEGGVKTKYTLEEKGVNLIASDLPEFYRKKKDELLEHVLTSIGRGEELDYSHILRFVADVERDVLEKIKSGSTEIFAVEKIGELKSYKRKDEPHLTPYFAHMFWNEVFKPKYGEVSEPDYMAIKVPLLTNNVSSYRAFVESLPEDMRERYNKFMGKYKKTQYKVARIPLEAVERHGLPEELVPFVDHHSIVEAMCAPLYMILEVCGFIKKSNVLLTEQGY